LSVAVIAIQQSEIFVCYNLYKMLWDYPDWKLKSD
jgi:hypothetical protein